MCFLWKKGFFFSFDLFPYLCFATVCVCFEYKLSILVANENLFQELCHSGIFFFGFQNKSTYCGAIWIGNDVFLARILLLWGRWKCKLSSKHALNHLGIIKSESFLLLLWCQCTCGSLPVLSKNYCAAEAQPNNLPIKLKNIMQRVIKT